LVVFQVEETEKKIYALCHYAASIHRLGFQIKKHMKDDALRKADKATVMCASRKTEPLILKGCMPDYSTDIVANKIRKII